MESVKDRRDHHRRRPHLKVPSQLQQNHHSLGPRNPQQTHHTHRPLQRHIPTAFRRPLLFQSIPIGRKQRSCPQHVGLGQQQQRVICL